MNTFFKTLFTTKTGILGLVLVVAGAVGVPFHIALAYDFQAIVGGFGLLFLRHAITKSQVALLDPMLSKVFGAKLSAEIESAVDTILGAQNDTTSTTTPTNSGGTPAS